MFSNSDLKPILLFYSISLKRYIVYLFHNLLFFIMMLALTIPCFFMLTRMMNDNRYYIIFLACLIPSARWFRKRLMRRRLLEFNIRFIHFLEHQEAIAETPGLEDVPGQPRPVSVPDVRKEFLSARQQLQALGLNILPYHSLLTAASIRFADREIFPDKSFWNTLHYSVLFMETALFLLISLPFTGIAFLFTAGMNWTVTLLILSIGFFFSWFLYAALAEPLLCLFMQKKSLPRREKVT